MLNPHRRWIIAIVACIAGLSFTTMSQAKVAKAAASAKSAPCDVATIKSAQQLDELLKRRAVEFVNLASQPTWQRDPRLAAIVDPAAIISMGGGDVVNQLGTGVAAAHALAQNLGGYSYRFYRWDYMDGPVDACSSQKLSVDFFDDAAKSTVAIEFEFVGGRVTVAAGWGHSFETGLVADLPKGP